MPQTQTCGILKHLSKATEWRTEGVELDKIASASLLPKVKRASSKRARDKELHFV